MPRLPLRESLISIRCSKSTIPDVKLHPLELVWFFSPDWIRTDLALASGVYQETDAQRGDLGLVPRRWEAGWGDPRRRAGGGGPALAGGVGTGCRLRSPGSPGSPAAAAPDHHGGNDNSKDRCWADCGAPLSAHRRGQPLVCWLSSGGLRRGRRTSLLPPEVLGARKPRHLSLRAAKSRLDQFLMCK